MVNIYCGGTLKATYGQKPDLVAGFNNGNQLQGGFGQMWRVADVTAMVDANGNTTDCTVKAIHPPMMTSGYYVTTNNNAY
jgi:hypothetical protein